MELNNLCRGVYPSCPKIKSQSQFIVGLFTAAGEGHVSKSYAKQLFTGAKRFVENQKSPLRGKDNLSSLITFFETEISDVRAVLIALGIPEKGEPNKKALAAALAQQVRLLIESAEEDVEDILILQYQQAKQNDVAIDTVFSKPLYMGDNISVYHNSRYEIQSFEKITHTWEITNEGSILWKSRKLVYKRGPKDRPEANPNVIDIPDVPPKKSIKITTTIDGRGFDGVTHCIWEMQDSDGENCFPARESLLCVTIDAKFKRK